MIQLSSTITPWLHKRRAALFLLYFLGIALLYLLLGYIAVIAFAPILLIGLILIIFTTANCQIVKYDSNSIYIINRHTEETIIPLHDIYAAEIIFGRCYVYSESLSFKFNPAIRDSIFQPRYSEIGHFLKRVSKLRMEKGMEPVKFRYSLF